MRAPNRPRTGTLTLRTDLAPATISNAVDIVEYYIKDSSPVNKDSPGGYTERTIHSELVRGPLVSRRIGLTGRPVQSVRRNAVFPPSAI